jgi:hypothetical protein
MSVAITSPRVSSANVKSTELSVSRYKVFPFVVVEIDTTRRVLQISKYIVSPAAQLADRRGGAFHAHKEALPTSYGRQGFRCS